MGQLKEKTIRIRSGSNRETIVKIKDGETLFQGLREHGILLPSPCGGRGSCGKCKVQIQEEDVEITVEDRKKLSEEEIRSGYRLACMCEAKKDFTVVMPDFTEERMETVTSFLGKKKSSRSVSSQSNKQNNYKNSSNSRSTQAIAIKQGDKKGKENMLGIAIDLGTTTIALALVEGDMKNVLQTHSRLNSQRQFGADVISRITASNQGKLEELKHCVREDLRKGITELIDKSGYELDNINEIVIAANTTMVHLLMGYSCETLGIYPFTPVNLQWITKEFHEIFAGEENIPVHIIPGISTYVGGDIVAGIYGTRMNMKDKATLLLDLGTNGEMALVTRQGIWVASTAAGPAFEGGNISCGVGSVAGAIKTVRIEEGKLYYDTIEDQYPIGICGTGIIELIAELLDYGIIDQEGTLIEEYRINGIPVGDQYLTQEDIRELQLAKAAIVTGIEILLHKAGVSMEEIESLYLAGGFGYYLNKEKAGRIGLIPKQLLEQVEIVGNSSLGGAIEALFKSTAALTMASIVGSSKEVKLAMEDEFETSYLNAIRFP